VMATLPEPYRLALLWRYWEKRSTQEMAMRTGKTEKAIEGLLARVAVEEILYSQPAAAPSKLKSQIYSAVMLCQAASGPLASLTQTRASGHGLCFFEELVCIAPAGERMKSLNICRVCHARVLAEHLEKAPNYWPDCPYVKFQGS